MAEWNDVDRDNELRDPAWRWQTAAYCRERGVILGRSRGDTHINRARLFAIELAAATTESQRILLPQNHPHLYRAWWIYGRQGQQKNFRFELEARLVAREPQAAIARKMHLPEAVVHVYAATFFDVADRLASPGYLKHFVISPARNLGAGEYEPQVVWKSLGYAFGPAMVDFLVHGSLDPVKTVSAEEIPTVITSAIINEVKRQALVNLHLPRLDERTKSQMLAHYFAVLEQAKAAGVGQSQYDALHAGIQSILENLPWTRDAAEARKKGLIHELELETGVNLRADELMLCAAGQEPEGLRETIMSCKFPARVEENDRLDLIARVN